MILELIAASSALLWSLRHVTALRIRLPELTTYLQKSLNFSLCYLGFKSGPSVRQALSAGKAAFLCCAYDVVTDWRAFSPDDLLIFRKILAAHSAPDLAEMAISLYFKDRDGHLSEDGLERGPITFIFVTRMMGTESFFKQRFDVKKIGTLLQLTDDILDYEKDIQLGDLNCLKSENCGHYLLMANELSEEFIKTFSSRFILPYVIRQAREKAESLLISHPISVPTQVAFHTKGANSLRCS